MKSLEIMKLLSYNGQVINTYYVSRLWYWTDKWWRCSAAGEVTSDCGRSSVYCPHATHERSSQLAFA